MKMKLIYVDGYKIRQFLDTDFNILHFNNPNPFIFDSKWYIPKDEIWFDHRFKGEEKFLMKVELTTIPNATRKIYQERFCKKGKVPNFVVKTKIRKNLKIEYVDGKIVREYIDPLFNMGGHYMVYSYIPKNEVWIDNRLDPKDIPHLLTHELYELELMRKEKSYDVAHDYATAKEKESRRLAGADYFGDKGLFRKLNIGNYYINEKKN